MDNQQPSGRTWKASIFSAVYLLVGKTPSAEIIAVPVIQA
jgi:hypothetical protein